ncbi:Type 1 glutamine amidotransferase-like domain-containing protein [Candidatus Woesearchaeota archaeon]|nr:Type 1 glutamine amidotransferase-like domain-containing protein [Candidatus Woesearchaeota archaeon]
MILILSGGGKPEETKETDRYFVDLIPKNKKILYIPIAKKTRPFEQCFQWLKSCLSFFGFSNIEMWTDLSEKNIGDLKKFSAIYIGGGNTFSLLDDLRNMDFLNVLKEFIENDGIVYGSSAGAMILGKDISTASYIDKNEVNLKNTAGINLLNDYSIYCHYQEKDDVLIKKLQQKKKLKILALPEGGGIVFKDGQMTNIGEQPLFVFEFNKAKRKIAPKEKI